ncbi:unnamed protein product [Rotaria sp. Silwood2]|nr:unnamed protein product [Rotaria sp. Silwood2]
MPQITAITNISMTAFEDISATTSSRNEASYNLVEQDLNAFQETYSINNVVVDLREFQSLLSKIEDLIKQTHIPDFPEEAFVIETHSLCLSLKNLSTAVEYNCFKLMSHIKSNRGNVINKEKAQFISRDPYDNKKYNDDELRYLVTYGPNHEILSSYPQNLDLKRKKKQSSFNSSWYNDFPYLEYSIKNDSVFCFCCRLFGVGPGGEHAQDAWSSKGVSSWSKMTGSNGKLVKHFKSTAHVSAENRLLNFSQKKTNVDLTIDARRREADQKREQLLKLNEKIIISLIDVARFLSRQSLSFQGDENSEGNFVAIIDLLRRRDPVLDQWFKDASLRPYRVNYLHHDSQNEFIDLLGNAVPKSIIEDINEAEFISITTDSTTDISHKEIYTIIIRFSKNFIVQERIISLTELNSKVGEDICKYLLDELKKCGISTDKITAQSYDNAPNMSGKNIGVQACLSQLLGRKITFIPCGVHSTNLVIKHGSNISIEYVNCFGILQELYNFFNISAKRHSLLCESLSKTEFGLLVKDLSRTRWSDRYEAIRAVFTSYQQIINTLQKISETDSEKTTKQTAENLLNKLCSFSFYIVLIFLKNLMAMTNALVVHLQKIELDVLTAIDTIQDTINVLEKMYQENTHLESMVEVARKDLEKLNIRVDLNKDLLRLQRRKKDLKSLEQYYCTIFRKIIESINDELKEYLSVLNSKIKHFVHLSPKCIHLFSKEEAKQLQLIVPRIDDHELLFSELQLLKMKIAQSNSMMNVWEIIRASTGYPRAQKVYNYLLTLPVAIATNERCFHKLKLIKTYLRSAMHNERLFQLMLCAIEKDKLDGLDLHCLAKQWTKMKDRRIVIPSDN